MLYSPIRQFRYSKIPCIKISQRPWQQNFKTANSMNPFTQQEVQIKQKTQHTKVCDSSEAFKRNSRQFSKNLFTHQTIQLEALRYVSSRQFSHPINSLDGVKSPCILVPVLVLASACEKVRQHLRQPFDSSVRIYSTNIQFRQARIQFRQARIQFRQSQSAQQTVQLESGNPVEVQLKSNHLKGSSGNPVASSAWVKSQQVDNSARVKSTRRQFSQSQVTHLTCTVQLKLNHSSVIVKSSNRQLNQSQVNQQTVQAESCHQVDSHSHHFQYSSHL